MVVKPFKIMRPPKLDIMTSESMTLYRIKDRYHISDNTKKRKFAGAFYVSPYFAGASVKCQIGFGMVNGVEATLNGSPVSGIDDDGYPVPGGVPELSCGADGYVALKVIASEDGKSAVSAEIEWAQEGLLGASGDAFTVPIAHIKNKECSQLVYFDFVYSAVKMRAYRNSNLSLEDKGSSFWVHHLRPAVAAEEFSNGYRPAAQSALPSSNYALRRWV
jgi:hypothetical protein